jgi:hypothetical protein
VGAADDIAKLGDKYLLGLIDNVHSRKKRDGCDEYPDSDKS